MKKLTNVLALEMVLAMEEVKSNQELVEKLTKMKEQFEKKNNSGTGSKKLTKTQPEGFYPMVLMTNVEYGTDGNNKYTFQTKANHSSAKTPLGMQ